ncbi:MAG: nitroreductase family protein [Gammaproteobacteria bacterium]|nr:nitroreductase family protein [Gammaproteobacteria bacterium]
MSNSIIDDLLWRKACKKYDPTRKVSEEDLAVLFEAMRLSASSINSQPWKFIVLDSPEAKERMNKTFSRMHEYNKPHVLESSQFILFAYNPQYNRENYDKVVDQYIEDGRVKAEKRDDAYRVYPFVEFNTDETGSTVPWTRAQTYIALGNALHTLARLKIDSTPIEGIDSELVNEEFKKELDGYRCDVALAIGYHHEDDYNSMLPKSRLKMEDVLVRI